MSKPKESKWEEAKRLNKKHTVMFDRYIFPKGLMEKFDKAYPLEVPRKLARKRKAKS